jgi:hypothetical protein
MGHVEDSFFTDEGGKMDGGRFLPRMQNEKIEHSTPSGAVWKARFSSLPF